MKYPTHIILDVQQSNVTKPGPWEKEFTQLLSPNTYLRAEKLHSSGTTFLSHAAKRPSPGNNLSHSLTFSIFDIHLLRKEKLYTKLKYSRCPQYDIVSGGFAALLAGFIGFLISEKFGIELVDSGDFYNAFMYGVFLAFSLRPLLRIYSRDNTPYTPFSLKYLFIFTRDVSILLLRSLGTAVTAGFTTLTHLRSKFVNLHLWR